MTQASMTGPPATTAPPRVKSRLLRKQKKCRTDGSQIGPGWYHVKRQSRIDNTASAVIRSTFDRSDDPTLPTMSRGNMRHVGPGSYTWQVPGMWKGGQKFSSGDRWIRVGHMSQTEYLTNPRLAPCIYDADQYHNFSKQRFVEQCNHSALNERLEAEALAQAGEGKYPLTLREREEKRLNAQRPALEIMPDSIYWPNGALISDGPRFRWQRGPQSHTFIQHGVRPRAIELQRAKTPELSTKQCAKFITQRLNCRPASAPQPPALQPQKSSEPSSIEECAPPPSPFVREPSNSMQKPKAWDEGRKLSAKFWVDKDKIRHCAGQPLVSSGCTDPRGLRWSYYEAQLRLV